MSDVPSSALAPDALAALLTSLSDHLRTGLTVYRLDDPDDPGSLRLLYANRVASDLVGFDLQPELGKTIRESTPEALETGIPGLYAEVARSGVARELGEVVYDKEGSRIAGGVYTISLFPLPERCVCASLTFARSTQADGGEGVDIAVREARFRTLAQAVTAIVWSRPPSGDFETDQASWSTFTGQTTEELKGRGWLDAVHPDDRERTEEVWNRAVADQSIYRIEHRLRRHDGEYRFMTARAFPVLDAAGVLTEWVGAHTDVTDQRAADRDRALLAAIVDSSDDAIISKTLEGVITSWNVGAERIFGYTASEAIGQSILMLIPRERQGEEKVIIGRIRRGERVDHFETVRLAKDGRSINISLTVSPVHDSDGRVIGASKVARDVSDQRNAKEALFKSEQQYRLLADTAADAIVTIGPDSVIRYVNRAVESIFGYDPDELVGTDLNVLMPEYLRALHHAGVARYLETGEKRVHWGHVEVPGLRKDGTEIALVISFGEYHQDGEHLFTGILRDVTAHKAVEDALRDSEAYLRLLLDSSAEAFYAVDTEGVATLCNAAFLSLLGFEREEEVVGQKLHGLIHHSHPDGSPYPVEECPIYLCARTGQPAHVTDEVFFRPDGTSLPVEYSAYPIRHGDELQGAICTFADVTDQRRADAALRESEERSRLALDAARLGLWSWEPATDAASQDARTREILGLDPDAALTMTEALVNAVHDDDRTRVAAAVAASADPAGDGRLAVEYRAAHPDGTVRWVQATAQMFFEGTNGEGRPARMVGTLSDITEQREAQAIVEAERARTAAAEAQLRELVDNLPDLAWWARADGHIDFYNRQWYEYTGTTYEEMEGRGWEKVHHPDMLPKVNAQWQHSLETGEPFEMEFPLRGADGVYRWFLTRVRPLRGDDGVVDRWIGQNVDVDDRRRTEKALTQSEARFRQLADAVPQIVYVTSIEPEGPRVSYLNAQWFAYTGQAPDEAYGATAAPGDVGGSNDPIHPDDRAAVASAWALALETAAPFGYEFRLRRHDGVYEWHLTRCVPVPDEEGRAAQWYGTSTNIHEQKEAARLLEQRVEERTDELRVVNERLNGILDGTSDLIAAVDRDHRLIAFNTAFNALLEATYGFPLHIGMGPDDVPPEVAEQLGDQREVSHAKWERALAGESFSDLQADYYPNIGFRAFDNQYSPIRGTDGTVTGAVSIVRDVTDREVAARRVETFANDLKALHRVTTTEHESLDALFEDYLRTGCEVFDTPVGIISETPVDPATGERLYRLRAVVSPTPEELSPGITVSLKEAFCDEVVARGRTVSYEDAADVEELSCHPALAERGLHAFIGTPITVDGALFGTLNFVSPEPRTDGWKPYEQELIEIMAGTVGRMLSLDRAESARLAALETTALREQLLREAQEIGHMGSWTWDIGADHVWWSDELYRIFGLTPGDFEASFEGYIQVLPPDEREHVQETVQGAIAELRPYTVDHTVVQPDGSVRHVASRGEPVLDAEGRLTGMQGIAHDVTERVEAERALQRFADELVERNEELQQFAYVASHDLQEPLRMVTSFLQLLERRYSDKLDETAGQYIAYAVDGARRMQSLIQDLLAYSRVGTKGRPFEPVETGAVIETVLRDLGPAIEQHGATVEVAGTLPTVSADPTQIHQVFQNLIGNALKFQGTAPAHVRVEAKRVQEKGRSMWRFSVEDNGIGLDEKYADRIFQIFQRLHTRDEYEGTGIGLAIVRKIVERHGGSIGYTSKPGEGATFWFTLPVTRAAPNSTGSTLRASPPP